MRDRRIGGLVVVLALLAAACGTDAPPDPPDAGPAPPEGRPATTSTTSPPPTTTPPTTATSTTIVEPPPPIAPEPPEGHELVWQDEFDGDGVDPSNWIYDIGGWGWGNGEAQYYTDRAENARVENGLLVIELRQEQYEGSYYTSARLKTQGLREFRYGRIEARLKVPSGAGTWPAFWMLGADFGRDADDPTKSNWPDVGEIDIMEYVGRDPTLVIGTVHGPGYSGAGGLSRWNRQTYDVSEDFHTFAVDWNFDGIRWFYDGEPYFDLSREAVGDREWVFDRPFFIILNLALGGTLGGTIALDLEFPKHLLVDYVRVYQPIAQGGG